MKIKFLLLFLLFFGFSNTLKSQYIQTLGPNYYSAGIPTDNFEHFAAISPQRSMNWCWAACVQMVLNYYGIKVTQEDIVVRCFGHITDHTGGPREMFIALSGWAYNIYGGISTINSNNYPTNANEIQSFLATGKPLIVGLNQPEIGISHAYVLTAIFYKLDYDVYGNAYVLPDKVVLRDPWPTNPSRVEISWNEFTTRVISCYKVWIT